MVTIRELLPSCLLHHLFDLGLLFSFRKFFCARSPLSLFKGPLGSELVNLRLSVCSLLLHLSKSLDFFFFLISELRGLFDSCILSGQLFPVVLDYAHLFLLFLFFPLLLYLNGLLVARLYLKQQ